MVHNYIVVREDLAPAQRVLQGIHAALIARATGANDNLVFLTAPDESTLAQLGDKLEGDLRPYRYHEDEGEGTPERLNAIAFVGVHKEQRKHFRDLPMWRG